MDLTPSTPQTSSSSSNDMALTGQDQELDAGSECGWRDTDPGARPIFYMGEEDQTKYSVSGLYKNLEGQKIRVGICAMAKKTHSKPMKEILARLTRFENLQVDIFDESVILNEPVEAWPVVDALISFFSTGFPLQKAIQYKNLHKPFVVNDLEAQYAIKDRREVYKILVREGIAHPRYAVMNRDCEEKGEFSENEDAIDVNGTQFQRPFVEKPVDAEDHNIYIYFPVSAGGGCQKLFRKVGSRSSVYSSCNRVRKIGSFIYEDFMPTDGTDVKVYTVGPDYAHAEARKSPALDGKVERDKDGKEVRYPVLLSAAEKMIARKVCLAFKQNVCGFDLLRTGGKSYVCDVNGFSFVKNSTKYYDDCANVLGTMIIRALAPQLHIPLILGAAPEDIPVVPTTSGSMMELRCVIAVIRHGDRTPKQKMKMEVKHKKFFDLFEKYNGYKKGHLKLKKPKQLQEVLDISRDLLTESHHETNPEVQEKKAKLRQLKLVLEMYGHFSGINRKVQLKYQPNGAPKKSSSEEDEFPKEPSLVLIVKWGGELTPAGKFQAEDLGKAFRTLYPGGQGEFETPGLGFLRLHSTFRHDLKIYASDEGRVQMTAAAFTKGLLALEGELTPILVSMVKSANTNGLLDKEGETSKYQHVVKEKLMDILNHESDFNEEDIEALAPTGNVSLLNAMDYIKNPKYMCDQIYEMVCEITNRIKTLKLELKTRDLKLYHGESWELLIRRWSKLEKDFKLKCGKYDISKIPDIYDCIKYDLQHNQKTLQYPHAEELFLYSKALADIVIPQEYGITVEEKMHISQSICTPLMRKIHSDLVQACQGSDDYMTRLNSKYSKGVASPERFVRTRLYFTSESHIHSLLNMLRYGGLCEEVKDEQWKKAMDFLSSTPELNYMTQINIMMFEDPSKDSSCPEKFHVELHFSPGAYTCCDKNVMNPVSSGYRTSFLVKQTTRLLANNEPMTYWIIQDQAFESINWKRMLANKFREPGMKKGKEDSCQSSLKDKLKDGLITEEISEEASDVSATNSLVVGDNNKKGFVMTEAGIKDFFTRQTIDNDDNRGRDSQKHESGNQNDDTIVDDGNDAVRESLDTSKYGAGDVNVSPSCVTISVDDAHGTRTDEFRDPDHLFIVDDLHDVVECKHVSEDSSVSSAYLTAEETEEDKCVLEELDNLTSGAEGVNKQDTIAKPGMDKSEHESTVTSQDKLGSAAVGKSDTKEIETENKCDKTGDVVTKPVIKLPTTLNVTSVLADGKQDGGGEKKKKAIDADKELELLLPKEGVIIPEQRSPDPDVPEWDWGDDKVMKEDKSLIADKPERPHSTGTVKSLPITISSVSDTYLTTGTELKKSYEETRSHSLEEGDSKDGGLALLEKHYRTIHLPINNDSHHSFSSLLYLNPDAFKAFDGFNMVPSLKPLETLHNNLTMQDLDEFLCRATTPKFFTPVSSNVTTPLPSPRCPELNRTKSSGPSLPSSSNSSAGPSSPTTASTPSGPSLPSSSNSSAGPSSPTTASTPIDFLSRFKMYIIDSVRNEQYSLENDTDISSESSIGSVGLRQDSNQATVIPQRKFPPMSEPYSASPTPTDGLNMSSGHASAFKAVSRSSSQKTQFVVTQVSEDSLRKDKSGKSENEEKKE